MKNPTVSVAVVAALLAGMAVTASATLMTVDEYISNIPGNTGLSGTVDMTAAGNTLTITLINTSDPGSGADYLLTGIGFELAGYTVLTGVGDSSVVVGPTSSSANPSLSAGDDVSGEWGVAQGSLTGHFQDPAVLSYNLVVSCMQADTDSQFSGPEWTPPNAGNLDGPEFGLLSSSAGSDAGGLHYIQDSVVITLVFDKALPGSVIADIEAGNIGLTFGSPTGGTRVPDGGLTAALLGLALLGLGGLKRLVRG